MPKLLLHITAVQLQGRYFTEKAALGLSEQTERAKFCSPYPGAFHHKEESACE